MDRTNLSPPGYEHSQSCNHIPSQTNPEETTRGCTSRNPQVKSLYQPPPARYRSNSKSAVKTSSHAEAYLGERSQTNFPLRLPDAGPEVEYETTSDDMEFEDLPSYSSRISYGSQPQRPLIDSVKNEWRTDPKYGQTYSPSPEPSSQPLWLHAMTARRFRRYSILYLFLTGLCWLGWKWYLRPTWDEHTVLSGSLDERMRTGMGWFGSNMRPVFNEMVHLKTLDHRLVPGMGANRDSKRLIIVGDVHGCKDECIVPYLPRLHGQDD